MFTIMILNVFGGVFENKSLKSVRYRRIFSVCMNTPASAQTHTVRTTAIMEALRMSAVAS